MATREGIARWMRANMRRFADLRTGETNLTEMVETWDIEQADGSATLDSDHPAWEVAAEVDEKAREARSKESQFPKAERRGGEREESARKLRRAREVALGAVETIDRSFADRRTTANDDARADAGEDRADRAGAR